MQCINVFPKCAFKGPVKDIRKREFGHLAWVRIHLAHLSGLA